MPAKPIKDETRLPFSISRVQQGRHIFHTLTMPIEVLARTTYVITRKQDPDGGFQRALDHKRAQEIADYIDLNIVPIPNAIILSAQQEAELEIDKYGKTLSIKDSPRAFLILDGQHRVYGFKLANNKSLRVPVVIFNNLTKMEEARLFIDINTKQRPVPNELLLDIKKLAQSENNQETFARDLFDLLQTDPSSCMKGLMSPHESAVGKISRVTFRSALTGIYGTLKEYEPDAIFRVLNPYLQAFTLILNKLGSKSPLITNSTVFKAVMNVFPHVLNRVHDRYDAAYTLDNFAFVLGPIADNLKLQTIVTHSRSFSKLAAKFREFLDKRTLQL
jgi:DGQHR domain-containing protein